MIKSILVRETLGTISGGTLGTMVWWGLMEQVCQNSCPLDMGQTIVLLATAPLSTIGGAIFGWALTGCVVKILGLCRKKFIGRLN